VEAAPRQEKKLKRGKERTKPTYVPMYLLIYLPDNSTTLMSRLLRLETAVNATTVSYLPLGKTLIG
jgi:hypothetical protein